MLTVEGYICLLHAKSSTRKSWTGAGRRGLVTPQRLILKEELRMKKVLSLVLAFAMILGSFAFAFASDFPDVPDNEYFSEPVNVLSGLGVIGGFPDGTFKPEKEVTRAEMATMVVNALGMTVTGQADTKFTDVPKSHWASGFINYATSVGFVAGYPDGSFKPDDPVTYDQALTMIVAAEGYKAESLPGTWPGSFVNKAKSLGMLDICSTTGTANAPREDIACFLYKALTNKIGYTDKDGAFHENLDKDGKATDTMISRLGGTPYNGGNPFVVDGTQTSDIDLNKYFGAYITAYAAKDDTSKIIAVAEVKSEFIEGKLNDGRTTIKGDSEYKVTSNTKDVDFTYFENGEIGSKTWKTATVKKNLIFAVKLDGAKVAEVYSAQEWTPFVTFRAASDIQEELEDDQTLNGGSCSFVLDDDDEIDASEFIMVGKTALADLAENDVITVYLDGVTSGDVAKLEVSTATVEGEITKMTSAKDAYTIAGTKYDVAKDALPAVTGANVEDEGTFYLNYAGEIFDYEATKTVKHFGVVLDTGVDVGRYSSKAFFLKMFIEDGTTAELEVDASATGKMATYLNDKDSDGKFDEWGTTKPAAGTLVEYSVDSDNVVVALNESAYTTKTGTTGESFDKNGIYGGVALKSTTVIFSYSGDGTEYGDASDYAVKQVADVVELKFDAMTGLYDKGDFVAVLMEGAEAKSDAIAIFANDDFDVVAKGNTVRTVLYEGAAKEITLKKGETVTAFSTGAALKPILYKLTFTDDVATAPSYTAACNEKSSFAGDIDVSGKIAVSGNSFKDAANTNFSLDAEAVVYIYDISDDAWTVGKLASVKYEYIGMIGTKDAADEEFDIVIAVRK